MSGRFVDQAAGNIILAPPGDEEEARLATLCVNRHVPGAEAYDVLEMLGLPPVLMAVRPRPEPGPRIAPMLAHRAARATRGRS